MTGKIVYELDEEHERYMRELAELGDKFNAQVPPDQRDDDPTTTQELLDMGLELLHDVFTTLNQPEGMLIVTIGADGGMNVEKVMELELNAAPATGSEG